MKGSLSVNSLCVKCRKMIAGRTIFNGPDFCKACLHLVRYAGAFMPSGHVSLTLDDGTPTAEDVTAAPRFFSPPFDVLYLPPEPMAVGINKILNILEDELKSARVDRDLAFKHLREFPQSQAISQQTWCDNIRLWRADIAAVLERPVVKEEDQEEYIIRNGRVERNPNYKGV